MTPQSRHEDRPVGKSGAAPELAPALAVDNLRAYYLMHYFGVEREVRAVDDISLIVGRNEIYGLAGESSCGKTTFLKSIAAAVRPPLTLIGARSGTASSTATSMPSARQNCPPYAGSTFPISPRGR